MGGLGKATRATNIAMLNAGRLIEDSAFGLRGMSNNITPAITSFNALKTELGSTSKALRVFGKGMITATGAVSVIVPILITLSLTVLPKFIDKMRKGAEKTKELEEATKALNEQVEESMRLLQQALGVDDYAERRTKNTLELAEAQNELRIATEWLNKFLEHGNVTGLAYAEAKAAVTAAENRLTAAQEERRKIMTGMAIDAERERVDEELRKEGIEATTVALDELRESLLAFDLDELLEADFGALFAAFDAEEQHKVDRAAAVRESLLEGQRQYNQVSLELEGERLEDVLDLEKVRLDNAMLGYDLMSAASDALAHAEIRNASDVANAVVQSVARMIAMYFKLAAAKRAAAAADAGAGAGAVAGAAGPLALAAVGVSLLAGLFGRRKRRRNSFRSGITNFGGGLAQVHRDEILRLPPGTDVVSQAASRQAMRRGEMGATPKVEVVLQGDLANLVDKIDINSQRNERARVGTAIDVGSRR